MDNTLLADLVRAYGDQARHSEYEWRLILGQLQHEGLDLTAFRHGDLEENGIKLTPKMLLDRVHPDVKEREKTRLQQEEEEKPETIEPDAVIKEFRMRKRKRMLRRSLFIFILICIATVIYVACNKHSDKGQQPMATQVDVSKNKASPVAEKPQVQVTEIPTKGKESPDAKRRTEVDTMRTKLRTYAYTLGALLVLSLWVRWRVRKPYIKERKLPKSKKSDAAVGILLLGLVGVGVYSLFIGDKSTVRTDVLERHFDHPVPVPVLDSTIADDLRRTRDREGRLLNTLKTDSLEIDKLNKHIIENEQQRLIEIRRIEDSMSRITAASNEAFDSASKALKKATETIAEKEALIALDPTVVSPKLRLLAFTALGVGLLLLMGFLIMRIFKKAWWWMHLVGAMFIVSSGAGLYLLYGNVEKIAGKQAQKVVEVDNGELRDLKNENKFLKDSLAKISAISKEEPRPAADSTRLNTADTSGVHHDEKKKVSKSTTKTSRKARGAIRWAPTPYDRQPMRWKE